MRVHHNTLRNLWKTILRRGTLQPLLKGRGRVSNSHGNSSTGANSSSVSACTSRCWPCLLLRTA